MPTDDPGGPLGPTKRTTAESVTDVVNQLTVFVVVRAPSHEGAAKLFEGHPHFTIFPRQAPPQALPPGPAG
ncbi:hypothetical protein [Phenylobacterium hankyongense]|uniref:hypothetical protein n=1 Tax=Phenylobacterium hankyongense TaxID=1813876 RepID=UPI001A9DBE2C|nr:hypothetical protein [Phenylobacterium hankyongense]